MYIFSCDRASMKPGNAAFRIYSVEGEDVRLEHPKISRDVCEIGPCDLVIVALKATSNSSLEKLLPPLLRKETMLLTLQNGLGNEEFLARPSRCGPCSRRSVFRLSHPALACERGSFWARDALDW